MIARLIAIAIVIASTVGLVALSVLEGLQLGYGLALVAVVLFLGFHVMTAVARTWREAGFIADALHRHRPRERGLPSVFDHPEIERTTRARLAIDRKRWTREEIIRGADIDAIVAADDAHNRLGL